MTFVGADTAALRDLARLFDSKAQALMNIGTITARSCMESPWAGGDADDFRSEWNRSYHRSLFSAATMLLGASRRLLVQADEQERASAGDGAMVPGWDRYRPGKDDLSDVLRDYQVREDEMVKFPGPPLSWAIGQREVTKTEAELLSTLSLLKLKKMQDIADQAFAEAKRQYPGDSSAAANDGHQDAFRHAYWNALMTKEFGEDFTRRLTTAHEGVSGNPADREAMDLYNNEVGRGIAGGHPDASASELADLVRKGIDHGDMVVIDKAGDLAYSDEVNYGEHGQANDRPGDGGIDPRGAQSGDYVHGTGS